MLRPATIIIASSFLFAASMASPLTDSSTLKIDSSYFEGLGKSTFGVKAKTQGTFITCPDGRGLPANKAEGGYRWFGRSAFSRESQLKDIENWSMKLLTPKDHNISLSEKQLKLIIERYTRNESATSDPYKLVKEVISPFWNTLKDPDFDNRETRTYLLKNSSGKTITLKTRPGNGGIYGAVIDSKGTKLSYSNKFSSMSKSELYCSPGNELIHSRNVELLDLTLTNGDGTNKELPASVLITDIYQKREQIAPKQNTNL